MPQLSMPGHVTSLQSKKLTDMARQKSFTNIGFEDFRALAQDASLSKYERIGFPDSYREGLEQCIFADILGKLGNLLKRRRRSSTSDRDAATCR